MAKLKITHANNHAAPTAGTGVPSIPNVAIGADHKLTLKGTGPNRVVCCTLIRHGRTDHDESYNETISRTTRFAKSTESSTPSWTVAFEVKHKATYIATCHSDTENDYLEIVITQVPEAGSDPIKIVLSMNPPQFKDSAITTIGTVFNANNPVLCTLTPISSVDGTTSTASGPPPVPSQMAMAVFTNPPANTAWAVSFAPLPGKTYSGWYLLEATAANEGTVSASGNV